LFLGVIQGIIGTIGVCSGIASPIVVGYLTFNQVYYFIHKFIAQGKFELNCGDVES